MSARHGGGRARGGRAKEPLKGAAEILSQHRAPRRSRVACSCACAVAVFAPPSRSARRSSGDIAASRRRGAPRALVFARGRRRARSTDPRAGNAVDPGAFADAPRLHRVRGRRRHGRGHGPRFRRRRRRALLRHRRVTRREPLHRRALARAARGRAEPQRRRPREPMRRRLFAVNRHLPGDPVADQRVVAGTCTSTATCSSPSPPVSPRGS